MWVISATRRTSAGQILQRVGQRCSIILTINTRKAAFQEQSVALTGPFTTLVFIPARRWSQERGRRWYGFPAEGPTMPQ
jgi:hypothetical protein